MVAGYSPAHSQKRQSSKSEMCDDVIGHEETMHWERCPARSVVYSLTPLVCGLEERSSCSLLLTKHSSGLEVTHCIGSPLMLTYDIYCSVHPGEGSSSLALLKGSSLFSPERVFSISCESFLIRCEVKGQGCQCVQIVKPSEGSL